MVRERQYIFLRVNLLIDMLLSMAALVAAYFARAVLALVYAAFGDAWPAWVPEIVPYEEGHLFNEYAWLFPVCAVLWPLALNRWSYYDLYDLQRISERRAAIVKATLLSIAILILAIFVFKQQFIARTVVVGTGLWAAGFLLAKEAIMRNIFLRLHARPEYLHKVVVVADDKGRQTASELIDHFSEWGVRIARRLDIDSLDPDRFAHELTSAQVDEVVFAVAPSMYPKTAELAYICELLGLRTRIVVDFYRPAISNLSTEYQFGMPILTFNPTTQNFGALTLKLFCDRVGAALLLVLLSPLLLAIAVAVKLSSPGPVVLHQTRCGLNGKLFTMHKFRSMVANAEKLQAELAQGNQLDGWAFKMENDPRVTRAGRVLRRWSLDELPQLWNVLCGDMSLVGPRPALPDEVRKFKLWERRRLSMKPGMTGLWQVSGRTRLPNEEWASYDLKYIDTWCLTLDFKILAKTVWVVLRGEGV